MIFVQMRSTLILLLISVCTVANAGPKLADLVNACKSAKYKDAAATYGCSLAKDKTKRKELADIFDQFSDFICSRGADAAQGSNCSPDAEVVMLGYRLGCEAVKQRCGCSSKKCNAPGELAYNGVPVYEAGSSCQHPIYVEGPSQRWAIIAKNLLSIATAFGAGGKIADIAASIVDPSSGDIVDQVALKALIDRIAKVPDGKKVVIRWPNGSKTRCYTKIDNVEGRFILFQGST